MTENTNKDGQISNPSMSVPKSHQSIPIQKIPWENNISDLNVTWQKLVKFEVLGEILSSFDSNKSYSDLSGIELYDHVCH